MAGWDELAANVVADRIPPGWPGPDSDMTVDTWVKNRDRWNLACTHETHGAKTSAIEFRLNETLQGNL